MTLEMPKRLWAWRWPGKTKGGQKDTGETGYIRADHALAPVAAAYEDAAKFALDTADQEQGDDGVTWGDMAQIEDAIHSRTPADAQAALDKLLQEARNETRNESLREAVEAAERVSRRGKYGHDGVPWSGWTQSEYNKYKCAALDVKHEIEKLITEDQSDE